MTVVAMDPYEKLAERLNKIPNGFAKAKDGTHIKILQWIFTEDEAELASQMRLWGETVQELSSRLNIPTKGLSGKLETMVEKGQIQGLNTSTGRRFALMPFVVGIYEEQLDRMDAEFAALIEHYFDHHDEPGHLLDTEPAIFKVIPVKRYIESGNVTIYPYEQAEEIIERSASWGVRDCICKKQQELIDNPCKYPMKVCLNFAPSKENAFENHPLTTPITKEEALEYLYQAEEEGLIHCAMNVQTGHDYICNCCTCCCGILRGLTERDFPLAFVNSNFQIHIDTNECEGCGDCEERCQFQALKVVDDLNTVELEKCVGCGVCAIVCPNDALSLVPRPESERTEPPESRSDWMTQKGMSRQVDPSDLLERH